MRDDVSALRTSIAAPLFDLTKQGYFTCAASYTNARYCPFTDVAKHIYAQFLAVLDFCEIEYFFFAGSLVGYVRNGRMPPWMDDIDIMIFTDQIPRFEERALPFLQACGFNCKPTVNHPEGTGYHVLAMQKTYGVRKAAISYSATQKIAVPWAQIDVFYSVVDDENIIRNPHGWGLYHLKDVPYEWIVPPQKIKMDGLEFTTFANIEADIKKEYGDVRNELLVRSHNKAFLQAASLEWEVMEQEFNRIVERTISPLTPSLSAEAHSAYRAVNGAVFEASTDASFDEIMLQVIQTNASEVHLTSDDQIFWVMDIKRLIPEIIIAVHINDKMAARIAGQLRQYIDSVTAETPALTNMHKRIVESFYEVLGDQKFLGVREYNKVA